ncbi:sigma 54-interacting transcriptional regulator [Desulfovibrio sp.]|uniref:sigma-54-dependent Fis family transcriptional regulator n=1 Tax=Desulfovibrio sp. TaxID=885 RepID=UPI0025BC017D|nr:sigma 54-interacting transcriptional regulator [Desulfovibrio sp.]
MDLAQRRAVEDVLSLAVKCLGTARDSALVRIWLVEPDNSCPTCAEQSTCAGRGRCLHLKASYGTSRTDGRHWTKTEGSGFYRFPLGSRKVGSIALTNKPLEVACISGSEAWIADPDWIKSEGIVSFAGQPLICRGETLGVIAVFSRCVFEQGSMELLRMVADHIAYSIANARLFEIADALNQQKELENAHLREELYEARKFTGIIGESSAIKEIREQIHIVGGTEATVLIQGDSGTGKELVAHELHKQSKRKNNPFIKINCAAIPQHLFESEFFGHVKGAFTGAINDRMGFFQVANGGTLFLDEVAEIPLELQGKLLRVIQDGEFRRVGEEKIRCTNVRLIAATNKNLKEAIQRRTFRDDLYYRLQVFPIVMPSLKEREEDIPLLVRHFIGVFCKKNGRSTFDLSGEQMHRLQQYDWPGNIRELQNFVERMVITGRPEQALDYLAICGPAEGKENVFVQSAGITQRILTDAQMRQMEKANLKAALERTNWLVYGNRGAAALLGIKPTTLISRLKRFGLYALRPASIVLDEQESFSDRE